MNHPAGLAEVDVTPYAGIMFECTMGAEELTVIARFPLGASIVSLASSSR